MIGQPTLKIAISLGESQWATRAKREHGVIAFLEGNTALAVSVVSSTILSAYRTGDKPDLVTPSACDTNVGTAEGEAGMMNIERAVSNPRRPSGNRQLMEC